MWQCRLDHVWHRRAIGIRTTRCGRPLNVHVHYPLRADSYVGKLCVDGCFSVYELAELAAAVNAKIEDDFRRECEQLQADIDEGYRRHLERLERERKDSDK